MEIAGLRADRAVAVLNFDIVRSQSFVTDSAAMAPA
jgi:hypothetical protein